MAKATAANLDFTNVKDGGQFNKKHYPPGDYPAKITAVVDATKKDDKSVKMWLFTIEVKTGKYPYYCNRMAENQLWKIRNLFVACGVNVPKKRVKVDPNILVGKSLAVTLEDEEYDNKMQSVVQSTFPLSELEDSDVEAEEDDEDDEDEVAAPAAADDEDEDDEDDEDEEPPPPPKKKSKQKATSKKKAAPAVDDDELEELEIEDI